MTGSQKHRDTRFLPYAFTELGVAMLSSVLNSDRAVQMNILIMRAFVNCANCWPPTKTWPATRALQEHTTILLSVVEDIRKLKNPPTTRATGFIARSPRRSTQK